MKILMFGGRGVLGRALVAHLSGHTVLATDLPERDVTDFHVMANALRDHKPDVVINLAGVVSRMASEVGMARSIRTNIEGAYNVAEVCASTDTRLIHLSTSEAYGPELAEGPVFEYDAMTYDGPANFYGLTKLYGEGVVRYMAREHFLDAVIVRPFMVYGPGEYFAEYRSAMVRFIGAALRDEPLYVHANTFRSWCYIDDFCAAMRLLVDADVSGIFNVGTTRATSMRDLADLIVAKVGTGTVEEIPTPQRINRTKLPDITHICSIGWQPNISLDEGVDRTIAWLKGEMS